LVTNLLGEYMNFIKAVILSLLLTSSIHSQRIPYNTIPDSFYEKENVKILVTDSGLGGLSIAAEINEKIKNAGVFQNVEVIFFNAQPHLESGYNSMESTEEKVIVFNNALSAMDKEFSPDIILIGCNTLSVIYEFTDFSKTTEVPVVGIVDTGVNLIFSKVNNGDAKVILFATETTVEQAKHKTQLMEKGITGDRIFLISCSKLAGNIERDPESRLTDSLVTAYVNDAVKNISDDDKDIYVSYNCTHYGYIDNKFRKAFSEKNINVIDYLNPNPFMVELLFNKKYTNRYDNTLTTVRVVSQAEITPGKIGSIYDLIEPVSSATAEALFDYTFTPDFFEWERVIEKQKQ